MTKVVHVIDSLSPGGAERQLAHLQAGLAPWFDNHVLVLSGPRNPNLAETIERSAGLTLLEHPPRRAAIPKLVERTKTALERLRPQLVHSSLFLANLVTAPAARWLSVPAVSTLCVTAGETYRSRGVLDGAYVRAHTELWGLALRAGHQHHVAISEAVAASATRAYRIRREDMTVIHRAALPHDPIKTEMGAAAARRALGLELRFPVILNAGRLVEQKGQRYLIAAMAEVVREFPRALLLVAGDGPLEGELAALIRATGLEGHVQLLGYRDDIESLMRVCDLFAFPSLFEGLGSALVEATAHGCPVVASDVGPIPEVVAHEITGLLVEPRSSSALARAIGCLARDPERLAAMRAAARARGCSLFSTSKMAESFRRVFERTLEASARRC